MVDGILHVLIDDELFEVDADCVDADEGGFWLAFEGEDEETFYEWHYEDLEDFE